MPPAASSKINISDHGLCTHVIAANDKDTVESFGSLKCSELVNE